MLTNEECRRARLARDPRFDGRFFVLVNSTGIFCRPVCKVRAPLEQNVEYAQTAIEAMQKGFRPCLRCRPDSAPQSFAWQGVQATVQRASKLLLEDFASSIESVSERLGVSARYLHKLMQENLHLAPKQFRIFHQVLLAKRLLQSSSMSVEQVAQAAGFPSSRQLQHHMKQTTSLTPTQIRKNQQAYSKSKASNKTNDVSLLLNYQGDYDWPMLRDFFARRLCAGNEDLGEEYFAKVLTISGEPVRVCMRYCPDKSGFIVSFAQEYIAHTAQIINSASKILDLHANPFVIFDALQEAGLNEQQINRGIRIPGICSRFEAGVRAILGQQVSVQAAITQLNRLQEGVATQMNNGNTAEFLRPQHLLKADLSFLKLPGARKAALKDFANLMHEEPEADFDRWLSIKGIGPWTVNYVRLRATNDTDIWLNTDLIIKQQIAKLQDSLGLVFDDAKAAPWRSYLTLSLWNLS
jgi:AraC family transcriptional regulator of adaptative response / DNA-3-methyladenine glycosylase II